MPLEDFCRPWTGAVFRHIGADRGRSVLDFSRAGWGQWNRWNSAGERTLYLAGDIGVAVAEWGRHLQVERVPSVAIHVLDRALFQLTVNLDCVIDLRDADVCRTLAVEGAPLAFLNLETSRQTAAEVRSKTLVTGMIVPTVAFLDDPTRWNLVLFLEKLPDDASAFITEVQPLGRLGLT